MKFRTFSITDIEAISPGLESVFLHTFLAVLVTGTFLFHVSTPEVEKIEFDVIQVAPKVVAKAGVELPATPIKVVAKTPTAKAVIKPQPIPSITHTVFGLSKKAHTAPFVRHMSELPPVSIRPGNTLATKPTPRQLLREEVSTPVAGQSGIEATVLPRLIREIKVPYPVESRRLGIQGNAVFDVWLDAHGRVQRTALLKAPSYELARAAQQAIYQFLFTPARIGERAVPMQIRYSYRFVIQE